MCNGKGMGKGVPVPATMSLCPDNEPPPQAPFP